ncbi:MAG: RidA family protein [Saccharospirillaceae bacterium]|nr:RidA family protein [Pseudomonadales bacterium]NRB81293.1 RidA family protein [Saccharospirillaceae bacterium]
MIIKHINPASLFNSQQFGFSQITTCDSGKLVFLSGQVGWNKHQQLIGTGDFQSQIKQTFENIKTAMTEVGGALSDIVSLRIYIVGENYANDQYITKALKQYFCEGHEPSATWVRVIGLATKSLLIEIEVTGVINNDYGIHPAMA